MTTAFTLAGSDSGGGAGIQADLKTFEALGVHGTCVITCVTAQNLKGVFGIEAVSSRMVRKQMDAVMEGFTPEAAKTGMLYSEDIIKAVVAGFKRHKAIPLVVDPVMVATSGSPLLRPEAVKVLARKLFPMATLITPNLDEAGYLTGVHLENIEDVRDAAKWLAEKTGVAILLKGGHLKNSKEALDILRIGSEEWLLTAPFIRGVKTHGTGCTYSAAIAAGMSRGMNLLEAVVAAKEYITRAIAGSRKVSGNLVLGSG